MEVINSVRLLDEKELKELFPGANIYRERLLGFTKSFIVFDGWNTRRKE